MSKVYLTQEIPTDRETGKPKYSIAGAAKYGEIVTLLPMYSQIIYSPGPAVQKLKGLLNNFTSEDYLLCAGDPAIMCAVTSIITQLTNGKFKLLKWDRQEKSYYVLNFDI